MESPVKTMALIIFGAIAVLSLIVVLYATTNNIVRSECKTTYAIIDKQRFILENKFVFNTTPSISTINETRVYTANIGNGISYGIAFVCIMLTLAIAPLRLLDTKKARMSLLLICVVSLIIFSILYEKLSIVMNKMCIATLNDNLLSSDSTYFECSCAPKLSFSNSTASCVCTNSHDHNIYILQQLNNMG